MGCGSVSSISYCCRSCNPMVSSLLSSNSSRVSAAASPILSLSYPIRRERWNRRWSSSSSCIGGRKRRMAVVVARKGPSTKSLIFAFALPASLLAATVFASLRIGDRLDQKFLEELAVNEAIREIEEEEEDEEEEDEEEEDDDNNAVVASKEEPASQRFRNRPRREI